MQVEEFVRAAKAERDAIALTYTAANGGTSVGVLLQEANLTDTQRSAVHAAIDQTLTDAFYTLLMALGGAASLGGTQQSYRLCAEDGSVISNGDGRLEAAAFAVFQDVR
jgi:hypothetical protein